MFKPRKSDSLKRFRKLGNERGYAGWADVRFCARFICCQRFRDVRHDALSLGTSKIVGYRLEDWRVIVKSFAHQLRTEVFRALYDMSVDQSILDA